MSGEVQVTLWSLTGMALPTAVGWVAVSPTVNSQTDRREDSRWLETEWADDSLREQGRPARLQTPWSGAGQESEHP